LEQKPVRSALFGIFNSLTPNEENLILEGKKIENQYLQSIGLIKDGLLTISLLFDYVKEKSKTTNQSGEIKTNEAGEILKGDFVLSDKLTSLEYKILKFMIQNNERVLDKEEIINAVWGEQKTTLGVTDQALDQLIFRVRKKIEENPNKPKHISTIKGRGFKFIR
jgi:DNA-binding winged helix-turn-helix (wHTH) protein